MIFGVLSVLAAAVLVGVDQLIKRWATVVLLPKTAMTLIPGVLELRYFLTMVWHFRCWPVSRRC